MPRDVYERWAALDQYGMFLVFGLFILFNEQTSRILLERLREHRAPDLGDRRRPRP